MFRLVYFTVRGVVPTKSEIPSRHGAVAQLTLHIAIPDSPSFAIVTSFTIARTISRQCTRLTGYTTSRDLYRSRDNSTIIRVERKGRKCVFSVCRCINYAQTLRGEKRKGTHAGSTRVESFQVGG